MSVKCKIYSGNKLEPEVKKFMVHFCAWCSKRLGISGDYNIILSKKGQIQGISTGGFDPVNNDVICRIEGRSAIDCVRTIAHELVHLKQKQDGKIKEGIPVQNIGGAIENEANSMSGILVKEYAQKFGKWIYDL
jgi:hypothetical protein